MGFGRKLFKVGASTAAACYTIDYLYVNNYLFSVQYKPNFSAPLASQRASPPQKSSTSTNPSQDLSLNPRDVDSLNTLSYQVERNVVIPIVKATEGVARFSRAMAYMSLVAMRYMILQKRFPTRYDEYGKEIVDEEVNKRWEEAHLLGANDILSLCLKNGGIFIKFGQYLSTMHYIVPEIYCEVLDVLKDRAPPTSISNVAKMFFEEFGREIHELFQEFDEEPIAAASVAQVHRAVTRDGREVAVKVQYPSVRRNFDVDTFTLDVLVNLTAKLFPGWNFTEIAPDVKRELYTELDFENEKKNARRASECFRHRNDVHIPEVYDELTSKRILTTEFIRGVKITDTMKLKELNISVNKAASIMLEAFAEQIFVHGHLHADPHAGNHMIRRNPKTGNVEIVILDHGLYQELTESFRIEYCKLWKALVVHDDDYLNYFCAKYNIIDPQLFSAMMLMRTYDHSVAFSSTFKKSDFEDLKDILRIQMERIMSILTKLPRQMLLVFRNMTILRSINVSLGASVNRFQINAKVASRGIVQQNQSFFGFLSSLLEGIWFRYWILRQTFVVYMFESWMSFGALLGLVPSISELENEVVLAG